MMKQALSIFVSIAGLGAAMPVAAQFATNPVDTDSSAEHKAGAGFTLVKSKYATLNFATYATIRYLNSVATDDTYTDAKGQVREVPKRNDIQFQKVTLYFKGWIATPKFRYFAYVWTSNANQGQGAQVVVAGNLQYEINKHFDIGAGIGALPTNRSLYGQWPSWLRQDARSMAEE